MSNNIKEKIYFTLVIFDIAPSTAPSPSSSAEEVTRSAASIITANEGFSNVIFDVSFDVDLDENELKPAGKSGSSSSILIENYIQKSGNSNNNHKRVDVRLSTTDTDNGDVWCLRSFINYSQFITKIKGIGPFLLYKVDGKNTPSAYAAAAEHPLCSRVIIICDDNKNDDHKLILNQYLAEAGRWKYMDKTREEARLFLTESIDPQLCSIKNAKRGTRFASEKFYSLRRHNGIKISNNNNDVFENKVFEFYSSNPAEMKYHKLIKKIIDDPAPIKTDRTGTGTKSIFAPTFSCKLYRMSYKGNKKKYMAILPLLTTKTVLFKSVYEELLWFLRADTDAKNLANKGVNIWNANSSKEALNKLPQPMKDYDEGQCGPIYGHQWRNFNSAGIDQIDNIIQTLKTDPTSRRMVLTAWNPAQLNMMVLPPCHILAVFYTKMRSKSNIRGLYCHLTMRSTDVGLGLPFNIASYSLLTHMIALCVGMRAKRLKITMVDCHIYSNHISALEEQISRPCDKTFPQIKISDKIAAKVLTGNLNIDDFNSGDIEVYNYFPDPFIKMKMAV